MTTYTSLPAFLTDIADAIRSKTGDSSAIAAGNMPTAIRNISSASTDQKEVRGDGGPSISFTGLNGEPKMFSVFPASSITLSDTEKRVVCLTANGSFIQCMYGSRSSTSASVTYSSSYYGDYSWTYNNGTLTIQTGSTSRGVWTNNLPYLLVYVY